MTNRTFEEVVEVLLSLDQDKVKAFVEWYNQQQPENETEHEFYKDLYTPLAEAHFTDFDQDEDEICNGTDFWTRAGCNCGTWLCEFGKIVDKTGF